MSFLIAFALCFLLTPVARRVGAATGLVDRPPPSPPLGPSEPLKIHRTPVSVLGGLAVTLATMLTLVTMRAEPPAGVAAAAVLALAIGLADDARSLPSQARLAGLAVAGISLAAAGARFGSPGWFGAVAMVLLVVVCANAVNLVDGQDGLAGGLAAIAALGLHLAAGPRDSGLGLALAGALGAFLVWNRPPARIFLGNGGAYAIGTLLAGLAADVWAADERRGVLVSILCLSVLAFELATTIVRRLVLGEPLTTGDREHAYDVLARRLRSRAQSTLVFLALSAAAVAIAGVAHTTASTPALVVALAVAWGSAAGVTMWARGGVR